MPGADGAVDLRSMDENLQRQMVRDEPGNDSSSDPTVHLICRLGKHRIENISENVRCDMVLRRLYSKYCHESSLICLNVAVHCCVRPHPICLGP